MSTKNPLDILKQYWGFPSFRKPQDQIIQSVLEGHDTLALLPTGGGKSICFQVPGLCLEGMTIVISPLIALMQDQVERLNQLGIPAAFVNSSMNYHQIDMRLEKAMNGEIKFLYIAPERIASEMFQLRLNKMPVSLLAVDEAHCISQWGYDFRPAYLNIAEIRESKPDIPVIALTASATPSVKQDILEKLDMKEPKAFSKSFRRENLRYFVLEDEQVAARVLDICQKTKGTGIVYARTRRLTEHLANMLKQRHISAEAYHGGLKMSQRSDIQQAWLENRTRIICATNAFGMGIDKPDVRFVIHHNLPFDLESYYQEAGRGGRDGQTALAIAFQNPVDMADLSRWSQQKYPSWEQLTKHYQFLCDHYQIPNQGVVNKSVGFSISELAAASGDSAMSLYASLKILHNEGILEFNEDSDDFAYVQVLVHPSTLLLFKENHPRLAEFIDFLLRNTGGEVYNQEVRFLLHDWGRKLRLPPLEVHHNLSHLAKLDLLQYIPSSGEPTIRFFQPKKPLNPKLINWDKYTFLQEQQGKRLSAMMSYVKDEKTCRSLLIQRYFGEESNEVCGKCDICIGRKKGKLSKGEFQTLMEKIRERIAKQSTTYRQAILEIKGGSPSQRERVLRYMLDQNMVQADDNGTLHLLE
ncbi:MAG: RecQ family ATP-dependent DNA helicase [Bacteroidota bacterium]